MKYDEKPDYEKYRKEFLAGLKSLGKSNSGELEFRAALGATQKDKKQRRSPLKAAQLSKITEKTEDSPVASSRRRAHTAAANKATKRVSSQDSIDEDEIMSPKKVRNTGTDRSSNRSTPRQSNSRSAGTSSTDPSIVINNNVTNTNTNGHKNKTYELNFELDISFDANVVVNVKRKPKKKSVSPKSEKAPSSKKTSIASSTDEIPPTEKSYAVGRARVYKRAARTSPRVNK